ncbi:MAG: hypothetical protein DRN21_03235 [Thermoplasmata archaeon]|nr:MAG: hypothetical protein DRN07_00300 [Thermoplasmata archaeon]RLF39714.1 MAG: hypothetical protein DRN21_03235 [Thermoplasmata archaeon]
MRKVLINMCVVAVLVTTVTVVEKCVAVDYVTLDPPFWEGDVSLVKNTTFEVIADNSGNTYIISSTTALGALDAASRQGGFDYSVNDEWYAQFGSLLIDSIAGTENQGMDGWQYWVNYPDDPLPWVGADNYELENGDTVDFFYGGYGITPDTSSKLIRIHVNLVEDNVPPEVEIVKPSKGGVYIFDREIVIMPGNAAFVLGAITVEVNVMDTLSGVEKVVFYVDDVLKEEITEGTYTWLWDEPVIGMHELKVIAYDELENLGDAERIIWIFSL